MPQIYISHDGKTVTFEAETVGEVIVLFKEWQAIENPPPVTDGAGSMSVMEPGEKLNFPVFSAIPAEQMLLVNRAMHALAPVFGLRQITSFEDIELKRGERRYSLRGILHSAVVALLPEFKGLRNAE